MRSPSWDYPYPTESFSTICVWNLIATKLFIFALTARNKAKPVIYVFLFLVSQLIIWISWKFSVSTWITELWQILLCGILWLYSFSFCTCFLNLVMVKGKINSVIWTDNGICFSLKCLQGSLRRHCTNNVCLNKNICTTTSHFVFYGCLRKRTGLYWK